MSVINPLQSAIYTFYRRWTNGWTQTREATNATNNADRTSSPRGRNARRDNGSDFEIDRSVMAFDTSAIPANATISSVVLHWHRRNERNGQNSDPNLHFVKVTATGDDSGYYNQAYFQGGYLGELAMSLAYRSSTVDVKQWATVNLDVAGIVKAGTTLIGCRMGHDYNGNVDSPGNLSDENYMESDTYNSADRPYLTITYTVPAVVTTGVASALQPISATLAGNVTSDGGGTVSERGVCWSTSANPTTANSKASAAGSTGAFTVGATGLLPGTLYHYRAYVTTENSTVYGDDITFRTPGGAILFNLL